MTVKEICNKMLNFNDDEREQYTRGLCKLLSPTSMATLQDFQNSWDGNKSPKEFFKAQVEEIKACVNFEIGSTGQIMRQMAGLEPLEWTTEVMT